MAGKKGVAVALQTEVTTEDEWQKLLEREGLVVVDVYSEWCGPCVGMVGNLKKLKLEIGSDYLHLAVAKSDGIDALKRFRNKSEPTWMFIASGHMVNLMFGANAPRLMRMITQELDRETKAIKGEWKRETIPFNELTQEEKKRQEELQRKEQIEKEKEAKELADALEDLKVRNMTRFAKLLVNKTVMVYFPHMIDENGTCNAAFKMLAQYDPLMLSVDDQMEVQLNKEELTEMLYDCDLQLSESFTEALVARPCLATLLLFSGTETSDSGSECPPHLGYVEERLGAFVYGHLSHTEAPVKHTVAEDFQKVMENGELWPGCWTPLTYLSKAAAVRVLFPHIATTLEFKEEELPPPRYCMIFDASRANEVNDIIEEFPEDILQVGFFDSMDPGSAKKVAKNLKQLEKLGPEKIKQTKMVLSVAKRTSDPLLTFSQLTPLYISPDTKVGSKECNLFFPPPDIFEEDEEDEDEKETRGEDGEQEEGGEREAKAEGEEQSAEGTADDKSQATSGDAGSAENATEQPTTS